MASIFRNYQFLGDSNFVRFLSTVKNIKPAKNKDGSNIIDLSVSGQGIRSLTRRLQTNYTEKSVVIMIGTNDIKNGMKIRTYKNIWRCLLKTLKQRRCKIVVLTLLPMPRYSDTSETVSLWRKYQKAIKNLKGVTILDIAPLFMRDGNSIKIEYFQRWIKNRVDLLHLNKLGLRILERFLVQHLPASID